MDCPYCSHTKFKVTDKRDSPTGIRRRRECLKCKKRFTTYEKIEKSDIYVIKKDNRREKFEREFCSRKEAEREAHEILKRQFEMSSYLTGHDSQKLEDRTEFAYADEVKIPTETAAP